jgi:PAS domain S-box-containing protein
LEGSLIWLKNGLAMDNLSPEEGAALYRTLTENLPGIVYRVYIQENHRMQFFNDMLEQLTGYRAEELVHGEVCSIDPLIHPEDRAFVIQKVNRAILRNSLFEIEYRLRHKNGTIRYMWERGRPVKGADGQPLFIDGVIFDITEKKQIEEELRSANEKLQALIQASPLAIIGLDTEGRVLTWNPAAESLLGCRENEVLGQALPSVPEGSREEHGELLRRANEGESLTGVEVWRQKRDGSPVLIRFSTGPLHDPEGNIKGSISLLEDVTAQRQTEEDLARRNAEFEAIFRAIKDVVAFTDTQRRLVMVNPAARTVFGFEPEELQGKSTKHLYAREADYEEQGGRRYHAGAREDWGSEEIEYRRKDGSVFLAESSGAPVKDSQGRTIGFVSIHRDITERKQIERALKESEMRLKLAQEAAQAGIWDWDLRSGELIWNEKSYELFGLNPDNGKPSYERWAQFLHPEDRDACLAAVSRTIEQNAEIAIEYRVVHPDGEVRWLNSTGQILCDDTGQSQRMMGINFDITERKRAEEETQRLLNTIHAEKEKLTALVNSISDEIWFANTEKKFTLANPAALREFGMDATEEIGVGKLAESLEVYRTDGTSRPIEEAPPLRALQGEMVRDCEEIIRSPATGELRHRLVSSSPVKDINGNIIGSVSVVKDITERKQAEAALKQAHDEMEQRVAERTVELRRTVDQLLMEVEDRQLAENQAASMGRLYRLLSRVNEMIVRAREPEWLFQQACRIMMEEGDFLLCWIGRVDREARVVKAAAQYDFMSDYPQNITISMDDVPEGRGPTGVAVREGRWDVCMDIAGDPRMAPWREQSMAQGFRSSAAFPLFVGGKVEGVLTLYSEQVGFFNRQEVNLLNSLAQDLSFAMESIDREAKRRQAEEFLKESEARLRFLTSQLLTAQEQERKRISYELHDDVGQSLTVLKMQLRAAEKHLPDKSKAKEDIEVARNYLNHTVETVRRISKALSPPILVDMGLIVALKHLFKETCREIKCTLHVDDVDGLFSPEAQITIYRIFQEILNNIVKHARANHIELNINKLEKSVQFGVTDNGEGFDVEEVLSSKTKDRGLGLTSMEERVKMLGGSFNIESKEGRGTTITINVPLSDLGKYIDIST